MTTTDLRAKLEVATMENLLYTWSDAHKDLYGFRPRHTPSREELIEFWATFDEKFSRVQEEENLRAEAALQRFQDHIQGLMLEYNISETDAIRWDMQACGITDDVEHYFWAQGLSCADYTRLGKYYAHLAVRTDY